ncbi:MAG: cupredoxin domain-containing protein [Sneathiella sp.]
MTKASSRLSLLSGYSLAAFMMIATSLASASGSHGDEHATKTSIGEVGKKSEVTRTIEVTMGDNYFEPENISIKKGETIRFVIKNDGEFVHEFNIGTAAMHANHQKEMMMMMEHGALEADKINHNMMKMDMGNGKTMQHNDPNSVLLEPSKSAEVIWKFSEKAKLEFACNVPGHYESGMMGEVRFN